MAIFSVTLLALIRMIAEPVSGRVFNARDADALYIVCWISAAGWLIIEVMIKNRWAEE